jgi:hypothetical protein
MPASDITRLVEIRHLIEICIACVATFRAWSSAIDHPFFTPNFSMFLEKYHRYIIAEWQLRSGLCSFPNDFLVFARCAVSCFVAAGEAEEAARQIDQHSIVYWTMVTTRLKQYWAAYARWMVARAFAESHRGEALVHCRKASELIGQVRVERENQNFCRALQQLRGAVMAMLGVPDCEPRSGYCFDISIETSQLPDGYAIPELTPDPEFLFGVAGNPTQPPRPTSGPHPAPQPVQAAGDPPLTQLLSQWSITQLVKMSVRIKFDTLLTSPDQRVKAAVLQFTLSMRAADENDAIIENMIGALRSGDSRVTSAAIWTAISQSDQFYTSLDMTLDQIDNQYQ